MGQQTHANTSKQEKCKELEHNAMDSTHLGEEGIRGIVNGE